MTPRLRLFALLPLCAVAACRLPSPDEGAGRPYDLVVSDARIVDGSGAPWYRGDVGVRDGRVARITPPGALATASAVERVSAAGQVLAPGFIDLLSWSVDNFLSGDGRAVSTVHQGITTVLFGEGETPAPVNPARLDAVKDPVERGLLAGFAGPTGFGAWLDHMAKRGTAQNVGALLGTGTVRYYTKGETMGAPSPAERDTMAAVVRRAMEDGAFGIGSSLIYPPDNYNATADLVAMAKAAAPYGGLYFTHMRSEGDRFLEAIDEAITVGREGGVPVEIWHLKAAGRRNWDKAAPAIAKIDSARAAGQDVAADMYLYVAGGNSLASCFPPRFAEGGKLLERLRDPAQRAEIKAAMLVDDPNVEVLCKAATPEGVMVVGFTKPELQRYEGKRLTEIAQAMGVDWVDAVIELTLAEEGRLGEILFLMSEENVKRQLQAPWMKIGTDAGGQDPARARGMTHPRAYGNYPRLLGKYVREERVLTLEDAVRRATSAPAARLGLADRGLIKAGMRADLVLFDPATIRDMATFEKPHQLATGLSHVWVNGVAVLRAGTHTGAKPGVVLRGPGWRGWK